MESSNSFFAPKPSKGEPWDVVIVGSGPAAFTAAIYTTRGAASTIILAGSAWGGQLMLTTTVDNYPGFPEGVQGPELMTKMRSQAERFGAEIVNEDVKDVDFTKSPFKLTTSEGEYLARSVIIATGADTKWLGVTGEAKLRGRGVSSCAPCDAPFFKGKEVAVVGGGDSAMEEALVLTKYTSKVTIIHRRDEFRASQVLQQRVLKDDKINVLWDSEVIEMMGENVLEKIALKTKAGTKTYDRVKNGNSASYAIDSEEDGFLNWNMSVDGLFVAIGHTPASKIFESVITLDEKGYVKRVGNHGSPESATNIAGVFVAGDVHDHTYRQAITAAGFGCMAGMDALKYLDKDTPSW